MIKHVILWKLKDMTDAEKEKVKADAKAALEALDGKIDGLLEMHILIDGMPCSSGDLMMDSSFASADALAAYQKHPLHVEIADGLVRPSMASRLSFDYEA